MARKKVKLEWIADNGARKATYKKRVKGLMKKVRELSVLCGVDACMMSYSRYHVQPEFWPSPEEVQEVVSAFRRRSESDHTKKVVNQESFISQRIVKGNDELVKERKKNRKKEMEIIKNQCLGGTMMVEGLERKDLLDLLWSIDNHLEAAKKMLCLVPWPQLAFAEGAVSTGVDATDIPAVRTDDADVTAAAAAAPPPPFDETVESSRNTSFDRAIEELKHQLGLTEQNQNETMSTNALADPDVSDFWLDPYIL